MINDYRDILDLMKSRRRELVTHFEYDDEAETAKRLGTVHLAILAIEAVMAEPPVTKTGPVIKFDESGWPLDRA